MNQLLLEIWALKLLKKLRYILINKNYYANKREKDEDYKLKTNLINENILVKNVINKISQ